MAHIIKYKGYLIAAKPFCKENDTWAYQANVIYDGRRITFQPLLGPTRKEVNEMARKFIDKRKQY
jgi:hypothetical protein